MIAITSADVVVTACTDFLLRLLILNGRNVEIGERTFMRNKYVLQTFVNCIR